MYLTRFYNVKLYKQESLIILDAVQRFPQARSTVKYWVADGRYDYIEMGFLNGLCPPVSDCWQHTAGSYLCYCACPSQLQKHDRKFRLAALKKEARFREYEDALF